MSSLNKIFSTRNQLIAVIVAVVLVGLTGTSAQESNADYAPLLEIINIMAGLYAWIGGFVLLGTYTSEQRKKKKEQGASSETNNENEE